MTLLPSFTAASTRVHTWYSDRERPADPCMAGVVMPMVIERKVPLVSLSIFFSLAMFDGVSTGWCTSSRGVGTFSSTPSRFGLGLTSEISDMTISSRIGSIGGFVTWANNCLK